MDQVVWGGVAFVGFLGVFGWFCYGQLQGEGPDGGFGGWAPA
jgi:hypothetical protein